MSITMFQKIPAPNNIAIPAQVIDEVMNGQKPITKQEEVEELKLRLDKTQASLDQERADKKQLAEKYKQLEAKTRISPTSVQRNKLRTKIVVNQVFREILTLKGSKTIYANIVIVTSKNKYVRLQPL